ncbi:YcxB family protein [Streptomyces sp. LaPpAH-108]|uniref:YcxB family protein n=1 Tax=Streptomyces sp. LaPpAH-108 TaxID=1155714 RepID=UPI000379C793|nr:YcxB family protein [Streptomyces sp. LaPpAH-108]
MVGDVVELAYRSTREDAASAVRARLRMTWLRWGRAVLLVAAGLALGVEAALLTGGHHGLPPGELAAVVVGTVLLLVMPWAASRSLHRALERQGAFRVTVTDAGITVVTDPGTETLTWADRPRYTETERVFVLAGADRGASALTVLPKQGLPDRTDVDRLRALLDRHVTRC